jgi:hypothetical protein
VIGSGDDFEYQLPASPRFFIGRSPLISRLSEVLDKGNSVLVFNAQSGWGKSSLALRLGKLAEETAGGYALLLDARTASLGSYLPSVLRRAALEGQKRGLLELPPQPSWATLASCLDTLAGATWTPGGRPLVIFFDQFENVFRDAILTREFRDLALGAHEIPGPLIIGFAWKTDLVGWTEGHPYQLRDEIRASAQVLVLEPLGPREVETLLRRLEKKIGQRLLPDLRRRLREYSQGLPWLLKKLAGHLIREIASGVTQETLLAEALNIQNLFEADLAVLQPIEQEALRFAARHAPVSASEVVDRFKSSVIQSLLDRRLLVQVGERLDVYWDTFRDFLNTGRVPIEDSYILRQSPRSVSRLLGALDETGAGDVPTIAASLGTSVNGVWNLSRELRLMGVTTPEPNRVQMQKDIWEAEDRESALRRRVSGALRRHRGFTVLVDLADRSSTAIELATYARELPRAFPAVDVADTTWVSYARALVLWFEYAGLVRFADSRISVVQEDENPPAPPLLGVQPRVRVKNALAQSPPGPSLDLLLAIDRGDSINFQARATKASLRELVKLGAVAVNAYGGVTMVAVDLVVDGQVDPEALRELLRTHPGFASVLEVLEADPYAEPTTIGGILRDAYGAEWSPATVMSVGKYGRAWARRAGTATRTRRPKLPVESPTPTLWDGDLQRAKAVEVSPAAVPDRAMPD